MYNRVGRKGKIQELKRVIKCNAGYSKTKSSEPATLMYKYGKSSEGLRCKLPPIPAKTFTPSYGAFTVVTLYILWWVYRPYLYLYTDYRLHVIGTSACRCICLRILACVRHLHVCSPHGALHHTS